MANPHRGEAEITLNDDSVRVLRYGFNELAELEKQLGAGLPKILDSGDVGFDVVRQAVYIGLKYSNKKLTPGKIGGLLDPKHLAEYLEKIGEAWASAMGADESEEPQGEDPTTESQPTDSTGQS
jgi:hypothetical protein